MLGNPDTGAVGTAPPAPLPFDRRNSTRVRAAGSALLAIRSETGWRTLMPVELRDASLGGLGATARNPVELGETIELYRDGGRFPHLVGTVARCDKINGQYRLGIRYAASLAA